MGRIRTWSDEDLALAVSDSLSLSGVIKQLGLALGGGTATLVKGHIARLDLDTSHFLGQGAPSPARRKKRLEDSLGNPTKPKELLAKLVEAGYKREECEECGLGPSWHGKGLKLQVDHIDGNRRNNVLSNYRVLCPNCHTQTPTWGNKVRAIPE